MAILSTTERISLHGLPGEGQQMHVLFQTEGQAKNDVGKTSPGYYRGTSCSLDQNAPSTPMMPFHSSRAKSAILTLKSM